MYSLLVKQFVRSRISIIAMLMVLIMGLIAILIGRQFLLRQEQTISQVTQHQKDHIERNVAANDEMGLLLYYLRFSLISKPAKLAALSIGQRDINPGIQSVTIRTLEAQKYDTDLTNPVQLQSGNLDLGFVIIYLLPLLIIALTFNVYSEDNENGSWKLVAVQSKSPFRFLLKKFSVRAIFLYGVLAALLLIAAIVMAIPLDEKFVAVIVISILYITFWFALSFWISMFRQSSGFNALTLFTVWVSLTVIIPAAVNNYVASAYPVPEALSTIVRQRDGYHNKWDIDKKITMDKFYEHYPQFKEYGVADERFWGWYYAMQQMGDDESVGDSEAMRQKLLQREKLSQTIAFVFPTMHTQIQFNDLAQTGLKDYLRLLETATEFHERTRLYFYPKIFENADTKAEDWTKFKPEFLAPRTDMHWPTMVLPLIGIIALLFIWAVLRAGKLYNI